MDDQLGQFVVAIGDLCTAASLARLEVEVKTTRGDVIVGVPARLRDASGGDEADDSGYAKVFCLDSALVDLEEVVECTVRAPARPALVE